MLTACGQAGAEQVEVGNLAFDQQDYVTALESYREAQEEAPESGAPFYNAANTHYRQEEFDLAEMRAQQAVQNAKDQLLVDSYFNLGNIYMNNQQLEEAIAAYSEALWLSPHDQTAKQNLELALGMQAQQEEQQQEQQEQSEDGEQEQEDQESSENQEGEQDQEGEQQQQSEGEQDEEGQEQQSEGEEEESESEEQQSAQSDEESEEEEEGEEQSVQTLRLTPEQAAQLLESVSRDTETLQQYLQQLPVEGGTPEEDW